MFWKRRKQSDFNAEVKSHLEIEADELAEEGLNPESAIAHCNLGSFLRDEGRFAESLKYLRRGHDLGMKKPGWNRPSEQMVKECERLIELEPMLPSILSGKEQPANAAQRVEFANLGQIGEWIVRRLFFDFGRAISDEN